jgi:hypothetical protein
VDNPPSFAPDNDLYLTADTPIPLANDEADDETDDTTREEFGEIDAAQPVVMHEDASHNSDEETSVFSFASERSAHTGDEDEPDEISARDYTVRKLYEQLQGGFHSCPVE